MSLTVDTRPVGAEAVDDLARLFETQRTTRHCWCMAFCATRRQFTIGWLTGGNRKRFETLASTSPAPMGILASAAGVPVGWCACGPRARYLAAPHASSSVLENREHVEDDSVWLVPCLFVRDGHRGQGVTHTLVGAAVELAREHGATAIEGWPLAASAGPSGDAFLGREQVFADLGFASVEQPRPGRVLMRLELSDHR
ncbi:MAG: GNAT family N-acetyltransferase [Propionibacteriaceae bacterium]